MPTLTISTLGIEIAITSVATVTDVLAEIFADTLVPAATARSADVEIRIRRRGVRTWRLSVGGETHLDHAELFHIVPELLTAINAEVSRHRAATDLVLHAGAFRIHDSAIVACGPSGSGKSTLVAAAVRRGFGYLCDEVSAIDAQTLVVDSYHRPIGLRPDGARALGLARPASRLEFDDLWPTVASANGPVAEPASVGRVVIVSFDPTEHGVTIGEVSPAHALIGLVDLTLGAAGREREMFRRLEHLVREVPVNTMRYSDPNMAAHRLGVLVADDDV